MAAAVAQFETMAEIRSLAQEFPQAACAAKKTQKPRSFFPGIVFISHFRDERLEYLKKYVL